jgi:hypothetical protein
LLAAAFATVAGCSSDREPMIEPTGGATRGHACDLLSTGEVSGALGDTVRERDLFSGTGSSACRWDGKDPDSADLSLTLLQPPVGDVRAQCKGIRSGAGAVLPDFELLAEPEDVRGLGESAWWKAERGTRGPRAGLVTGSLGVCAPEPNAHLLLTLRGRDAASLRRSAMDLARTALARL